LSNAGLVEAHIAIAMQSGCRDYRINNIAAAIADEICNLIS
jgi:hypothetical protein